MQFKVPQFLEIEDKIFGPFTFKEFVYLAGGGGMCFVLYQLLGIYLGVIPILAIAGFSLALTFYRPNNKPFINMVEAGFKYALQDKLYIWKRHKQKTLLSPSEYKEGLRKSGESLESNRSKARLGGSKLRDLAWSLDILDLKK